MNSLFIIFLIEAKLILSLSMNEIDKNDNEVNSKLPSLANRNTACVVGKKYRVDCNTCICDTNGDLDCDKLLCLDYTQINVNLAGEMSGKPCIDMKDLSELKCLNCVCNKGLQVCVPVPGCTEYRRSLHGDFKKPKPFINIDKDECERGLSYRDHCNKCICSDAGQMMCTLKTCLKLSQLQPLFDKMKELENEESALNPVDDPDFGLHAEDVNDNSSKLNDLDETGQLREDIPEQGEYGKDWVVFADDDDNLRYVSLLHDVDFDKEELALFGHIYYHLYTRDNARNYEAINLGNIHKSTYFKKRKPVKFLVHGWTHSGNSSIVINLKDAYLQAQDDNVIIVDWGELANSKVYVVSAKKTRFVGVELGKLVKVMMEKQHIEASCIHLIGHSLGAQTVGYAGRWLKQNHKPIARVTGLDPARPYFEYPSVADCINANDADFVDIIHTNVGYLGIKNVYGVADFYPNAGGPTQPGCDNSTAFFDSCSHGRAHEFFRESILNGGFSSRRCDSWESYKAGTCGCKELANMGENCPTKAKGLYFLETNPTSPFSRKPNKC